MVGHPAERVKARIKAREYIDEDVIENLAVCDATEQGLAVIAAQHHMVAATGNVQTRRSRHPCHSGLVRSSRYGATAHSSRQKDCANVQ